MNYRLWCALGALFGSPAIASPWIAAGEQQLKHSIDLLASYGVISHPVNQYPLMWQALAHDIQQADSSTLPADGQFALQHLQHALSQAKRERYSSVRAYYSSDPDLKQGFAERDKAKSGIDSFGVITGDVVSAKVAVNYQSDGLDGKQLNHDGSHLAVLFDNWALSAERLSYWWGPSNDNALLLSNHAPTMTAVRATRANSHLGPSFLSFLGAWQVTALVAKQRPTQANPQDGRLWALRFAATPITGLELATSTLSSAFVFDQERQIAVSEYDKQTLQSLDVKYSTHLNHIPFAVYGEWMGHNQSGLLPHDPIMTLGVETFTGSQHSRSKWYLEYSDQTFDCDSNSQAIGCPAVSQPFSQFTQRDFWLGAANGPQTQVWSAGWQRFEADGRGYGVTLRHSDGEYGNDRQEAKLEYQQGLFNGLLQVSARYIRSDVKNTDSSEISTENNSAFSVSWQYQF
ncbi:capsule assembly Wzi family protein [Pseudoalteromonas fenneropenaei]|uniref:Capsule assembly Wzi family protein n=1 Tax=Pseudoalteromonas fenneropenaei TaxID=1737459 RepID=A0ABV7CM55_9GAMM